MAYFGPSGDKVIGQKMSGEGSAESVWETDIAEAIERCEQGSSAKNEMERLLGKYPQLKGDRWKPYEHPLSPVVEWFVKQKFG